MENASEIILSWSPIFMLLAIWLYFFFYAYRHKVPFPWGFSIVVVGILVSGIGYHFTNSQVVVFSLNATLIVSLVGLLLNTTNIETQFHVRNADAFLQLIGTGLASGLLLGLFFIIAKVPQSFQIDPRYAATVYVTSGIQGAIAEELLFRGYFLNYLRMYNFRPVFLVTFQALIFALLHITTYQSNWIALAIIFLNGVTAGYLTWKNNNLIPALVLHIVFNVMVNIWWLTLASA